jgi:hypothetical protein
MAESRLSYEDVRTIGSGVHHSAPSTHLQRNRRFYHVQILIGDPVTEQYQRL